MPAVARAHRQWRGGLQPRHVIVGLCFLATFTAYVERVGFSIAFTSLARRVGFDEQVKGAVMSAFYWGYGVSQIPGGWAAQLYGGRRTLLGSFLAWSLLSLLTPMGSNRGAQDAAVAASLAPRPWLVAAARAGVGVAQGFLIPAVHTVLSQWVPPHERARAVSLSTSGMYLGSAAAMLLLPGVVSRAGPGASVSLVGALGLCWAALWFVVGREVPHREAIIPLSTTTTTSGGGGGGGKSAGGAGGAAAGTGGGAANGADEPLASASAASPGGGAGAGHQQQDDPLAASGGSKGRPSATPWRRMLGSPAVLAIVCNNFAFHYAFYVVLNWLPTFFSAVLAKDLSALGPLPKALPYLAMFACSNAGGWAGDWLIAPPRSWRVADARKAVNAAGMLSASAALMLMPLARRAARGGGGGGGEGGGEQGGGGGTAAGVAATTLVLSTLGFSRGGFSVNHMDIAPRHAGVVMGFSNTAGTLSGVIGVAATGWMLQRAGGAGESGGWWAAHGVAAAGCVAAAAVFQAFARGDKMFD